MNVCMQMLIKLNNKKNLKSVVLLETTKEPLLVGIKTC